MGNKPKQIISVFIIAGMLGYYFVLPVSVKKADAFLGIGDITFNTTIGDIPAYIADLAKKALDVGLKKLKRRLLTQIQNDLINIAQGNGRPIFITHPIKFLKAASDTAAVTALDKVFKGTGIDICSPFKANVEFLVSKAVYARDRDARCSLGDIIDNLDAFKDDFQNGGWAGWIKLHETNNTLPGAYFGALKLVDADIKKEGNAATAQISAGRGFLDKKNCLKAKKKMAFAYFGDDKIAEGYIDEQGKMIIDPNAGGRKYTGGNLPPYDRLGLKLEDEDDLWNIAFSTKRNFNINVQETSEYSLNGAKLKPGEICTESETVTPGSVVGDWVSGGLQKIGLDRVLSSDDISNLLDAFLDSAVNRAMKEGLSLITSGRGLHTTPFKDRAATAASQQQTAGLEAPDAVNLQMQMSKLRSDAINLKSEMQKIIKENPTRESKFESRLKSIAGAETTSGDYEEGYLFTIRLRTDEGDKTLADTLDRFFGKASSELTKEVDAPVGEGVKKPIQFEDKTHFHKESSLPGLYIANKALNQKLADIWGEIEKVFINLPTKITQDRKTQCYDIQYTNEPAIEDGVLKLPFILPDNENAGWSSKDHGYAENIDDRIKEIKKEVEIPMATISEIELKANYSSGNASIIKEQYQQDANIYESLTETMQEEIKLLDGDVDFVAERIVDITTYTSLLLNYDTAGQKFDLVRKIKDYNEMLGNSKADEKITAEDGSTSSALNLAYKVMMNAQKETRQEWLNAVRLKAAASTSPSAPRATPIGTPVGEPTLGRTEIATKANILIINSLTAITDQSLADPKQDITLQTGLGISSAVAQVMGLNIGGIYSELENRLGKVEQRINDFSKKIGKFLTNSDLRKQAGVEGGETEWEKHFYNRFQLAYAAFIYDFYKDRFVDDFCK